VGDHRAGDGGWADRWFWALAAAAVIVSVAVAGGLILLGIALAQHAGGS
jgi:hypothetical protein